MATGSNQVSPISMGVYIPSNWASTFLIPDTRDLAPTLQALTNILTVWLNGAWLAPTRLFGYQFPTRNLLPYRLIIQARNYGTDRSAVLTLRPLTWCNLCLLNKLEVGIPIPVSFPSKSKTLRTQSVDYKILSSLLFKDRKFVTTLFANSLKFGFI